ncbi:3'-5' RNA helicase YTHDC2-like isoform X2 [Bacillus rossius redtenbacheri]|uniref:3'-5' RNA helicase YTHDC2-like isoform X2 n=1 Tax=Bacillus rossius redtenbacheri TaxID=93214 RepID=UPI002FDF0011
MSRKKQQHKKLEDSIGEEIRIAVNLVIKKFLNSDENKEYEFPSSFTANERAYVHELAKEFGLKSKSRGKGANRFLTVYKREGSSIVQADAVFKLSRSSRQNIFMLTTKFPLTNKERQELLPLTERDRCLSNEVKDTNKSLGRLINGIPQVPSLSVSDDLLSFRQKLPIWSMKEEIINLINSNQVVVISGETGSGKTTQVPQFILEHCQALHKPCRIVCTQPRRLSAVSVSERVAAERDEKIGQSIGYQIRLESRISPKTVLTYCTDGVLLRTLMGGDAALATMTHVVVDEVHERGRFCDFLLIALRDALAKFRSLRLVLMSATVDTQVFTKYFSGCPVVSVPGRLFEVKEYFLEDVLKQTGYTTKAMEKARQELRKRNDQREKLDSWTKSIVQSVKGEPAEGKERHPILASLMPQQSEFVADKMELEAWLVKEMDQLLCNAWLEGSPDAFSQLLFRILSEHVSVDYQHSETSVTALMVAAGRGDLSVVEQLLNLGANISVCASNDWTSLDWARNFNHPDVVELIEAYINVEQGRMPETLPPAAGTLRGEDKELLDVYHQSFNDDNTDLELLMALVLKLHAGGKKGAILIFLSGYDDIVALRDRILADEKKMLDAGKFRIYLLHSKMQTSDQKQVFRPAPPGARKIILSTNIAETSVTIDDVVFVIDTGKVKEKSFDALCGVCTLRPVWISQACAQQRRGRAGRTQPGVCYHMFSSVRHQAMQAYHTPEILRLPLQELCLHTKLLAPPNTPIADFLARAIEPPSFIVTRNAVQLLKTMDALDAWEDLTELGHHLVDLPVEPRLGKMVLYAVVLKCLDPVLTIVSCLAHRDPFLLPTLPSFKRSAILIKKKLASGSFSDHMTLLRAFQMWQQARTNGWERAFCEKHFVSSATMEMVVGMRTQLLGQLRALGFVRTRGGCDIRDLNANSESWAVVKAALCAGTYPNLIRVDREHAQLRTQKESRVMFHPSSVLRDGSSRLPSAGRCGGVEGLPSDWLVYEEMSRTGRLCHARCCTLVTPLTVALFAGPARLPLDAVSAAEMVRGDRAADTESDSEAEERADGENTMLKLDEWVVFRVDAEAAHLALHLRQKWNSLLLRRMRAPAKPWSQVDEQVLKTVVGVLTAEEQNLGLQQPAGVGQRPRAMTTDCYSSGSRQIMEEDVSRDDSSCRPGVLKSNGKGTSDSTGERSDAGSTKSQDSQASSPTPSQAGAGAGDSPSPARYFVIKAGSVKAVEASLSRGLWAFTPNTERKLLRIFKGLAQLAGDRPEPVEPGSDLAGPNLGAPLPVEWLKRSNVPFQATRHLLNPYNENRRVQASRDGQEIEPTVGESLCALWDKVPQLVPKSSLFGPPRGPQQQGRPIRGYSYPLYGPGYQQCLGYGPRK